MAIVTRGGSALAAAGPKPSVNPQRLAGFLPFGRLRSVSRTETTCTSTSPSRLEARETVTGQIIIAKAGFPLLNGGSWEMQEKNMSDLNALQAENTCRRQSGEYCLGGANALACFGLIFSAKE